LELLISEYLGYLCNQAPDWPYMIVLNVGHGAVYRAICHHLVDWWCKVNLKSGQIGGKIDFHAMFSSTRCVSCSVRRNVMSWLKRLSTHSKFQLRWVTQH